MDLGIQLKRQREQQHLTQQGLADQLHVTRQTVSRWENGNTYPNLDTLVELSECLSISLDKLLKSDQPQTVPVVQEISRDVRLKHRYRRWLIGISVGVTVILVLLATFSWGHRQQVAAIDRVNPFLRTQQGYTVLPVHQTKLTVDTFVADDPFGSGSWLHVTTGQHGPTNRWALVRHRGAYVSGVRLVKQHQIPLPMREQAGRVYLKYHPRADGPRSSWRFWN